MNFLKNSKNGECIIESLDFIGEFIIVKDAIGIFISNIGHFIYKGRRFLIFFILRSVILPVI